MGRKTGLKEKKKKFDENNSWFGKVAEPAKKKKPAQKQKLFQKNFRNS